MDREKLIQRLMATFLNEYQEHLRTLEEDLLALEKDSGAARSELLQRLFRTFHSLKGAARSVNVAPVEAACHRLEGILAATRDGQRPPGPELIQLLFAAADALRDGLERLRAKQEQGGGPLAELLLRLEAAGGQAVTPPAATPAAATPAVRPEPAPAGAAALQPAAAARDGSVRVPAQKLDTLLARSGELLVARRRAGARQEEVAQLREAVEQARGEWRHLDKPLRRLLGAGGGQPAAGRGGAQRENGLPREILPPRAGIALTRTRENLNHLLRGVDLLSSRIGSDQRALEQAASSLEEEVRQVRMLPFAEACVGLERLVRDLGRAAGKEVEIAVVGGDVEFDRSILDGLRDPLLHLVRNAVDHGLEPPAERAQRGKAPRGRITVAAALRGGGSEVSVADDGRGLDLPRIREQATRRRLAVPDDDRELARLVFLPGFSTAELITEVSGRGVGLDVVKHRAEALHGSVDLSSEPGCGARFVLSLPLTLTTVRALLVECGDQAYALPAASVRRLIRAGLPDLGAVEGREVLLGQGRPVPVVPLAAVLGLPAGVPRRPGGKVVLALVADGEREVALAVDRPVAEQELVVKSLGARLRRVRSFAGGTVLSTGHVALILNASELVRSALAVATGASVAAGLEERSAERKRRLLVVDDSVTTRSLERSILEAAGYEVQVAADGAEAWRTLQVSGADLVVADVDMPRLDGFGLTETIRASRRFHALPVVLVTALGSEKDQARGIEVGANAYLIKSGFDQRSLLETIAQLL